MVKLDYSFQGESFEYNFMANKVSELNYEHLEYQVTNRVKFTRVYIFHNLVQLSAKFRVKPGHMQYLSFFTIVRFGNPGYH